MASKEILEAVVADWAKPLKAAEISRILDAAGVPNAKVASIPEVAASNQIAARDMVVEIEHPTLGPLRIPGTPIKMEKTPPTIRKAPPLVGEDNNFVYGDVLGFSPEKIAALQDEGAI